MKKLTLFILSAFAFLAPNYAETKEVLHQRIVDLEKSLKEAKAYGASTHILEQKIREAKAELAKTKKK